MENKNRGQLVLNTNTQEFGLLKAGTTVSENMSIPIVVQGKINNEHIDGLEYYPEEKQRRVLWNQSVLKKIGNQD